MTNTNTGFEAKSKWENDLEQRNEGEVEMIFNMADDITQALEGTYFTYDKYGFEVPTTNQIEAYEAVMKGARGYLMEAARRIEYYQGLEEKLTSALDESQALLIKQGKMINDNKLELADIKSSMKKYEEELDDIMYTQITKEKSTLLN